MVLIQKKLVNGNGIHQKIDSIANNLGNDFSFPFPFLVRFFKKKKVNNKKGEKMKLLTLCLFGLPCIFQQGDNLVKTITIDAGHGGMDGGAYVDGIKESTLDLEVALKVKNNLEEQGFLVKMTRTGDYSLPEGDKFSKKNDLNERLKIINETDLFVSIHMNTFTNEIYSGSQVFYSQKFQQSYHLASTIMGSLKSNLSNTTREIKQNDSVYLLKKALVPGVIVECGFMSNQNELSLLKDETYQVKLSSAISEGIIQFTWAR